VTLDTAPKELARRIRHYHLPARNAEEPVSLQTLKGALKSDELQSQSSKVKTAAGEVHRRKDRRRSALPPPTAASQRSRQRTSIRGQTRGRRVSSAPGRDNDSDSDSDSDSDDRRRPNRPSSDDSPARVRQQELQRHRYHMKLAVATMALITSMVLPLRKLRSASAGTHSGH